MRNVRGGRDAPFGARLRRLREAAGLTQEGLAERAGLTARGISDLERGARKRPYPHTFRSLADALGLAEEERAALLAAVPKRVGGDRSSPETVPGPTLPVPPTPLVGRERELEEIEGLLLGGYEVRLLTLTGIGGVGKTRLATAAARASLSEGRFPDGAAFVALAPLRDSALVVPAVARSLGLREEQGQSPREVLHSYLREKRMLLVLDNLEHLLDAATEVVRLIEACPDLVVLVTSRAPLRVRGEQEYPVPPLALPSSVQDLTQEIVSAPSGRLFVERAQAISPSFEVTSENAPSVAAICWRVAGLPLALELAAAKVRLLEPQALLSRLDQALSTAWARDLPERQRTVRATLDWNYGLLSQSERGLFRRLSVFAGGFTLEAAEAVGAIEGPEEELDLLGSLVEQSLVVVQPPKNEGGGGVRYGMLEPVRQYALELLEKSGEAETIRRLHAAFFLELAERAQPELRGPDELEWSERLESEKDNFRAAISWALGPIGDAHTAARLCWALQGYLWTRGYYREGRQWAEATLEYELPDTLRARALHLAGTTAFRLGDYSAARERWGEAVRLSQRAGDLPVEAYSRTGMGLVEMARSEHVAAVSNLEEAIALFEGCGHGYMASYSRVMLGQALLAQGHGERAQKRFEEALAWARPAKNPLLIQTALYGVGRSALARDNYEEAGRMLEEGIRLHGQVGDRIILAQFLEALAVVASSQGEAERSALLLGAAEGLLREVGAPISNPDPSLQERAAVKARDVLGEAAFEEAREQGQGMSFEQAIAYALSEADAPKRRRTQATDA